MIKKLTTRIDAVCPIHGLQATGENPRLWRIDFKDEATEEERNMAVDLLSGIDLEEVQAEIDADDVENERLEKIVRIQTKVIDALLEYCSALDDAGKPMTPKLAKVLEIWRASTP